MYSSGTTNSFKEVGTAWRAGGDGQGRRRRKEAPIMKAAQQMLVDWEAGKPEVIALWSRMDSGFTRWFAMPTG